MAHEHANRVTVHFDDHREPLVFEDASYTLWKDGVTVFKDGEEHVFLHARAVADKLAVAH
ncbi:hypothetical protein [Paractinoplanes toevensis]|uniref:Uncharacterized protein n=1 Tax=Paractinoplanes toevensis TaxID=571911 RepID=A0A919T6L0_9ACTN|nr:hypothetical protein [Actinoplanes toevensis]GIM88810.1 hypothetical protein Ato02nite_006030 [Actinoplanes toevensis]